MSSKKTQKQPKRRESIGSKIPSACENPDSFMGKHPAWKFARCDKEHAEWGFCHEQFDFEIMEKLESFESMTWAEILEASGGKSRGKGNNNHFIEIENLHKTARQRMEKLKIITDEVFSLRVNGKTRLYGLLDDGTFSIFGSTGITKFVQASIKTTNISPRRYSAGVVLSACRFNFAAASRIFFCCSRYS